MKLSNTDSLRGSKILLLFIVTQAVYVIILQVTIPQLIIFSGGLKPFDTLPMGYSLTYAQSLLEALGDQGRSYYLFRQIPLDFVYPLLFAISYYWIMVYFTIKLKTSSKILAHACLLPVLAGVLDYLENIGIIRMLVNYPTISEVEVAVTSMFSIMKSSVTIAYFLILVCILLILLARHLKKSNTRKH